MYRLIGACIGGFVSALISGGPCFKSPHHFGVFLACLFIGMALGSILDVLKRPK